MGFLMMHRVDRCIVYIFRKIVPIQAHKKPTNIVAQGTTTVGCACTPSQMAFTGRAVSTLCCAGTVIGARGPSRIAFQDSPLGCPCVPYREILPICCEQEIIVNFVQRSSPVIIGGVRPWIPTIYDPRRPWIPTIYDPRRPWIPNIYDPRRPRIPNIYYPRTPRIPNIYDYRTPRLPHLYYPRTPGRRILYLGNNNNNNNNFNNNNNNAGMRYIPFAGLGNANDLFNNNNNNAGTGIFLGQRNLNNFNNANNNNNNNAGVSPFLGLRNLNNFNNMNNNNNNNAGMGLSAFTGYLPVGGGPRNLNDLNNANNANINNNNNAGIDLSAAPGYLPVGGGPRNLNDLNNANNANNNNAGMGLRAASAGYLPGIETGGPLIVGGGPRNLNNANNNNNAGMGLRAASAGLLPAMEATAPLNVGGGQDTAGYLPGMEASAPGIAGDMTRNLNEMQNALANRMNVQENRLNNQRNRVESRLESGLYGTDPNPAVSGIFPAIDAGQSISGRHLGGEVGGASRNLNKMQNALANRMNVQENRLNNQRNRAESRLESGFYGSVPNPVGSAVLSAIDVGPISGRPLGREVVGGSGNLNDMQKFGNAQENRRNARQNRLNNQRNQFENRVEAGLNGRTPPRNPIAGYASDQAGSGFLPEITAGQSISGSPLGGVVPGSLNSAAGLPQAEGTGDYFEVARERSRQGVPGLSSGMQVAGGSEPMGPSGSNFGMVQGGLDSAAGIGPAIDQVGGPTPMGGPLDPSPGTLNNAAGISQDGSGLYRDMGNAGAQDPLGGNVRNEGLSQGGLNSMTDIGQAGAYLNTGIAGDQSQMGGTMGLAQGSLNREQNVGPGVLSLNIDVAGGQRPVTGAVGVQESLNGVLGNGVSPGGTAAYSEMTGSVPLGLNSGPGAGQSQDAAGLYSPAGTIAGQTAMGSGGLNNMQGETGNIAYRQNSMMDTNVGQAGYQGGLNNMQGATGDAVYGQNRMMDSIVGQARYQGGLNNMQGATGDAVYGQNRLMDANVGQGGYQGGLNNIQGATGDAVYGQNRMMDANVGQGGYQRGLNNMQGGTGDAVYGQNRMMDANVGQGGYQGEGRYISGIGEASGPGVGVVNIERSAGDARGRPNAIGSSGGRWMNNQEGRMGKGNAEFNRLSLSTITGSMTTGAKRLGKNNNNVNSNNSGLRSTQMGRRMGNNSNNKLHNA